MLTPKEFQLLEYMLQNKNIVLSRDLILERVWDMTTAGKPVLLTYIKQLRHKEVFGKLAHQEPFTG